MLEYRLGHSADGDFMLDYETPCGLVYGVSLALTGKLTYYIFSRNSAPSDLKSYDSLDKCPSKAQMSDLTMKLAQMVKLVGWYSPKPSTLDETNSNGWRLVASAHPEDQRTELCRITCNGKSYFLHAQGKVWERLDIPCLQIIANGLAFTRDELESGARLYWREYGPEYADD